MEGLSREKLLNLLKVVLDILNTFQVLNGKAMEEAKKKSLFVFIRNLSISLFVSIVLLVIISYFANSYSDYKSTIISLFLVIMIYFIMRLPFKLRKKFIGKYIFDLENKYVAEKKRLMKNSYYQYYISRVSSDLVNQHAVMFLFNKINTYEADSFKEAVLLYRQNSEKQRRLYTEQRLNASIGKMLSNSKNQEKQIKNLQQELKKHMFSKKNSWF